MTKYDDFEEDLQFVGRQLHQLKKPMLRRFCKAVGVPVGRTKKDAVENLVRKAETFAVRVEYVEIFNTVEVQLNMGYAKKD